VTVGSHYDGKRLRRSHLESFKGQPCCCQCGEVEEGSVEYGGIKGEAGQNIVEPINR